MRTSSASPSWFRMATSPAWARRSSRSWPRERFGPLKKRRTRCAPITRSLNRRRRKSRLIRSCIRFTESYTSHSGARVPRRSRSEAFCRSCAGLARARGEVTMLEALRAEVYEANLELVRRGLVIHTFGNASAISREEGLIVIKPSGVPYEKMTPADMVVTDIEGHIVEGDLRPSSDLPTHAALYPPFPEIGGIAHTHSRHATAWAQACRQIPCLGTTHADYFRGPVPVCAPLSSEAIEGD